MKHNYLSVSALFAQPGRYVVPLFQRPYVWTEDEQWTPLWEDIRRVADDIVANKSNVRSHFLGSVVLELQRTPAGHLATREVIDGQQRLTTLQLFLKAAADAAATAGATLAAGQLSDLVSNRYVPEHDSDGRFKVWPTEADQPAYATVIDAHDGTIPLDFKDHPFARAYSYFSETITGWLRSGQANLAEKADALSTALHQQIKLMALDIDPGEDAQVIFETLNARGTPLLPIDLVKNWLLREATRRKADVKKLYYGHWRKPFDLEIEYWREEVGRGHAQRPRADLFLQYFLTMRLRQEVASDRLYYRFLDEVEKHPDQKIDDRLAMLEQSAAIFRELDEPDEETKIGWRLARLKELDFVTVYPFLMALRRSVNDSEFLSVMEIIESFIVRRLVCGLSTRGYGTLFVDLMNAVIDHSDKQTALHRVVDFLLRSDAESSRWPNNAEFGRAWKESPLYERLARPRLRFILRALEEYLRTADGLTEPFSVSAKLEIEHVMPQSWESNWPLPAGEPLNGKAAENRRIVIHTVGNLTLLTKKLNITLSNAAWTTDNKATSSKQNSIKKYSLMMLSKEILDKSEWNEIEISNRTTALFDHACQVWPEPPIKSV
ncbi:MAG TPA: DUF262 domain-containing HNH endonuclease family protein [Xanthobacteraceae bacterium]|jgi:hypothetical protein|nr:DUF262 domain-containing HNH endonuclease family protein [Xanthobacteraceae bacterium]